MHWLSLKPEIKVIVQNILDGLIKRQDAYIVYLKGNKMTSVICGGGREMILEPYKNVIKTPYDFGHGLDTPYLQENKHFLCCCYKCREEHL